MNNNNKFNKPTNDENFQLVRADDLFASKIKEENVKSIQKVEKDLQKIIDSKIDTERKRTQISKLLIRGQSETQELVKRGFTGIALQNAQLFEQNEQLRKQIETMQKQLEAVYKELHKKLEQERLIDEQRQSRKNRKRQPIRQPITKEIYQFFISETQAVNYQSRFRGARLRLALSLLLVTGIRISELLPLKIYQVRTLFVEHWIAIDRAKRGPSSHKAFLTKEGAAIMKKCLSDLEVLSYCKEDNSYIFTAENSDKPLDREAFNRIINKFIKQCAQKIDGQPNLRSHSFRIGFITKLWRETSDIEFVRQAIGHSKIDTTSQYVENLSEEERKKRMEEVTLSKDLIINKQEGNKDEGK